MRRDLDNQEAGSEDRGVQSAATTDELLQLCVRQGIVPGGCQLSGFMVFFLAKTEDPCARCNVNRAICGGRPKRTSTDGTGSGNPEQGPDPASTEASPTDQHAPESTEKENPEANG